MFGFDGEYRRRPVQSLGGASHTCDRDTVIRKAAQERQKRNELRQKANGAVVLQSYARSFIYRQRRKRAEREAFDAYLHAHRDRMIEDDSLSFLMRRLNFFYSCRVAKDSERLIDICQQILRSPARLLQHAALDPIWLLRVCKLLDACLLQLTLSHSAQAIPLRMLETFTTVSAVERYVEDETMLYKYLDRVFGFLIARNYFLRLRQLLDEKCPPLDGESLHAPSPLAEALLQLLLRPLVISRRGNGDQSSNFCRRFIVHILASQHTEPVRYFVLPCLAECAEFPFDLLMHVLNGLLEHCSPDAGASTMPSSDNKAGGRNNLFYGADVVGRAKQKQQLAFPTRKEVFSSFLLSSLLVLDRRQLATLQQSSLLIAYVRIIAEMMPNILQLPKSTLRSYTTTHRQHDSDDSDESDDELEGPSCALDYDMEQQFRVSELDSKERDCLLESIAILNETQRVDLIVQQLEPHIEHSQLIYALCEICHNLMIYNKHAVYEYKLLYTLAFTPKFIRAVWFKLAAESTQLGFSAPLILISKGVVPKQQGVDRTIPLLATFCMLFGRLLPTLHDVEFVENKLLVTPATIQHVRLMPFSIAEIVQMSKTLKEISLGLVELAFPETRTNLQNYRSVLGHTEADDKKFRHQKQIWANLLNVVVFVLNQIHTRDLRLGFCPEGHWTVSRLDLPLDRPTDLPLTHSSRLRGIRPFQPIRDFTREDFENGPPMSTKQIRSITILREIPFVVAFNKRVSILQGLVAANKMRVQGHLQAFLQGPSIMITVRRSHLYEDAYDKLRPENEPDLRLKFRIQFVSPLGLDEAGIDGGGVFREFLSELIKTAFDPNRGFFMVTTDNKLYPNPNVADLFSDFEKHYYFIGRILGKAIYENLLVELPLAEFFLTKLAGKYSDVDMHQLASLDPELYRNLLYLKDYTGDVSELNLDFTVASSSLGQTQIVELKAQGQVTPVTNSNRIEYLQLIADYKLNVQIRRHCIAFRKGLSNVLPIEWLYMFSNKELQILISGAEIPIDLEDLKKHCKYGGEYSPEHPSIVVFWSALESFDDLQRRQLLKFVTSCSRPPLLGFKDLDPPFFIQNAGDMERLPTASTCTNLLKLPPFKTIEQMREKLLYAIQSGVGFELS
ncbi:ubiquitin-protein ligase E3C [Scaptodrosophila lebanonensis]|uniref:Ubiquitin-protein ligase E3C n=1 Tax=Drosophila lebanonensis TaxID=7225 RepID=A0A6J2TFC7_DROLE|nr:ubiquitin-protein ligase E3C [Scaptodrosophila lebanonensis]